MAWFSAKNAQNDTGSEESTEIVVRETSAVTANAQDNAIIDQDKTAIPPRGRLTWESDEQDDMASNEERLLILRMLEQGKISADEAARLLSALDNGQPPGATGSPPRDPFSTVHGLRIRIQDLHTGHEQVNINIPTALLTFGLRFVPASAGIDVQAIKDAVERGNVGKIIEVADQDSGQRVQIFIE